MITQCFYFVWDRLSLKYVLHVWAVQFSGLLWYRWPKSDLAFSSLSPPSFISSCSCGNSEGRSIRLYDRSQTGTPCKREGLSGASDSSWGASLLIVLQLCTAPLQRYSECTMASSLKEKRWKGWMTLLWSEFLKSQYLQIWAAHLIASSRHVLFHVWVFFFSHVRHPKEKKNIIICPLSCSTAHFELHNTVHALMKFTINTLRRN